MRVCQPTRRRSRALRVLFSSVLAAAIGPLAHADQVRLLDGDLDEDLAEIDAREGSLVLKTASGRAVAASDVKEVILPGAGAEDRGGPVRLFLTSGDELSGEVAGGDESKVRFRSETIGVAELDLELVRGIAYTADEAELRRFRAEVLPVDAKQDLFVARSWARQEGVLERIDDKGLTFSTESLGTVTLNSAQALGARVRQFGKTTATPPGVRARLELVDGSVLNGRVLGFRARTFTIETPYAHALEIKAERVRTLSFVGGRVVYLSDLDPAEVEERAKIISVVFRHRRDANVMGNPLRLGARSYRKGLGVHAFTRLTYKLDGDFARLKAVIGLDDEARARREVVGSVRFQVLVDGRPALGEGGVTLTTRDPPRPIDVDVAGAAAVTLVADFGESQDTLARGAWADAHLVKK